MMIVETLIEDERWSNLNLPWLADRAVSATLGRLNLATDAGVEISVLACDDVRIAALNDTFRDKPRATNVLSWPAQDLSPATPGAAPRLPEPDFAGMLALGDIALAWETCAREAEEAEKSMADHVTHLIVHGLLHLLGYDHLADADAARMETLETEILGMMGLDDPYSGHDGA